MKTIKKFITGFYYIMAIVICIAGCPVVPLIWLLIQESALIWIWLSIDIILTVLIAYSIYSSSEVLNKYNDYNNYEY